MAEVGRDRAAQQDSTGKTGQRRCDARDHRRKHNGDANRSFVAWLHSVDRLVKQRACRSEIIGCAGARDRRMHFIHALTMMRSYSCQERRGTIAVAESWDTDGEVIVALPDRRDPCKIYIPDDTCSRRDDPREIGARLYFRWRLSLFLVIAAAVAHGSRRDRRSTPTSKRGCTSRATPLVTDVMAAVSFLGAPTTLTIVVVAGSLLLLYRRRYARRGHAVDRGAGRQRAQFLPEASHPAWPPGVRRPAFQPSDLQFPERPCDGLDGVLRVACDLCVGQRQAAPCRRRRHRCRGFDGRAGLFQPRLSRPSLPQRRDGWDCRGCCVAGVCLCTLCAIFGAEMQAAGGRDQRGATMDMRTGPGHRQRVGPFRWSSSGSVGSRKILRGGRNPDRDQAREVRPATSSRKSALRSCASRG